MLVIRPFWQNRIEEAWQERSVIWLMGVRRVGKTTLCLSLENIEYFDCESPRVRQLLADPESFLEGMEGKRVVLDEIHRLDNPSELLKIAADHYKQVKIIATGSSTLGASAKFRDTLTGRKKEIWLTSLLLQEMELFGQRSINHRFLCGGIPPFFVQETFPEGAFQEWIDAYWARDIQELFTVGKRFSFQRFFELLLAHSGGQFEATKFAALCEVTRQTIGNYLAILEETFVVHVIRPYATHKLSEIVMAPKVYGFDTGFVSYAKGWREIRKEDRGFLWEHIILNELHAQLPLRTVNYWRDKKGHEVDFVVAGRERESMLTIECKYAVTDLGHEAIKNIVRNMAAFRAYYPVGENFVVAYDVVAPFTRVYDGVKLTFVNAAQLIERLSHV